MSLEHIIGSESEEVFKKEKKKAQEENLSRRHSSQFKELQMVKSETISATK